MRRTQQRQLVAYAAFVARRAGLFALFAVSALLGILSGVLFVYGDDLPQISALDDYAPKTMTRIYAAGGELIHEFATERRVQIGYEDMALHLRQAIVSAEDGNFNRHFGVSPKHIAAAGARGIVRRLEGMGTGRRMRPGGASTITQQLARNLFPVAVGFTVGDLSPERKIKEAIVALQIEKRYTKPEILTFYANQIFFGHGTYGVESAARLYFGKVARDVTLEEAALLAGIIQRPAAQSPFVSMDAAMRRRNYTLRRMGEEGYISWEQARTAQAEPIVVRDEPLRPALIAPHFVEEVRKHLEERYGAEALYGSGLDVRTTLDVRMQAAANRALDAGLRRIDKRRGYRPAGRNVITDGPGLEGFLHERWARAIATGDRVPALVEAVQPEGVRLRLGRYTAELTARSVAAWPNPPTARQFRPGDLIEVEIAGVDEGNGSADVFLEQTPIVEGALIAIENRTGRIRAMVGGWSFARSRFNRAVQAERQLGSTFKPVVYTAAIDGGFTPASILEDSPLSRDVGPGQVYTPRNYDNRFEGPITLRRAMEHSRNIPAVLMMEAIGPATVVAYAKRFGFRQQFPPYLSMAVGAGGATLEEVTSAYTVFPNQGVRMRPFEIVSVTDRNGNLLEENRPDATQVIRADTAFVVTSMLRGAVERGTAVAAASLNWPLAGKTGTVNDNTDAWFVGFDPDITVGVWTGLDERKPLGPHETGAVAALPIWIDFMRAYIADRSQTGDQPIFQAPGNIVFVSVDGSTGAPSPSASPGSLIETFIAGTQPGSLIQYE